MARRKGRGNPENFVALNIALYGAAGKRWALTERGQGDLSRDATRLSIGSSQVEWNGQELIVDIDEVAVPLPRRIKGQVRLYPRALVDTVFNLDTAKQHQWHPIAPQSRVEVDLNGSTVKWSGSGYFDHNCGSVPLEKSFVRWDWSRASAGGGSRILYDVDEVGGGGTVIAIRIGSDGKVEPFDAPPRVTLPSSSVWRIARATRADGSARIVKTLEDTPFYARSLVASRVGSDDAVAVHESLSLTRFSQPIVQAMLPFRMPRWPRR